LLLALTGAHRGQVLTVSSGGRYSQRFDLATLEMTNADYDGVVAYAKVKRAKLVPSYEWVHHVTPATLSFTPCIRDGRTRWCGWRALMIRHTPRAISGCIAIHGSSARYPEHARDQVTLWEWCVERTAQY
jgi:hypothetical protein